MIPPELRAEVRRLFYAEHWRIGTIASQLAVHHDTVRRAIESHRFVSQGRSVRSRLDPYIEFVQQTLDQYPRVRATRIHEMIVERGYPGSVIQTRRLVRRLRPLTKQEAFLRLRTLPGEQGQVDWGHFGHVQVGRAQRPLSAFVLVLSWSRALHVRFTLDQTLESFLRGHVSAFEYFGGLPRTLLYDNLKSVVLERHGSAFRFQSRLLEFAGHYHFQPQPVGVARGNEKGRVERQIRFLRDRFFAARRFRDVDDLNAQFVEWRERWAHARPCPGDDTMSVAKALDRERETLLSLPEHDFSCDRVVAVRSGKTPYVRFDTNDYSIPPAHVRRPLTLCASQTTVRLLDGDEELARHERCWDRKQRIEDPAHIQQLVSDKQAARRVRSRDRLCLTLPQAERFLQAVLERDESLGSTTRQLVGLLDDYGPDDLGAALDEALERGTPTASSVAQLLEQARRKRRELPPVPMEMSRDPRIRNLHVTPHRLEGYDDLASDPTDD